MDFVRPNFSKQQILETLKLYNLNLAEVTISKLTGIANDNYRVQNIEFDIALKIYSHGQSDTKKIAKELEAQELFRLNGINVPKLLKGKNERVLQTYNGFNVSASEFIVGDVMDKVEFTKDRMLAVGSLIALVETTSKELDLASFETLSLSEELNYVLKNLDATMIQKGYTWDLTAYYKNLDLAKAVALRLDKVENSQFLHKDIWPWNLIENNYGIYLLDFNDWAIGAPIIELAVPLLEFSMFKSANLNEVTARNIIEGYKRFKDLQYTHNDLWETFLYICYLYFPYNVIQSDDPFEAEIYLKRINTLLGDRDLLKSVF